MGGVFGSLCKVFCELCRCARLNIWYLNAVVTYTTETILEKHLGFSIHWLWISMGIYTTNKLLEEFFPICGLPRKELHIKGKTAFCCNSQPRL